MNYFTNNRLFVTLPALLFILVCATGCQDDDGGISKKTETLAKDISTETVLKNTVDDASKADYTVSEDIHVTSKLTIEPGVVLHFKAGTALIIEEEGTLIAKGSANQKIVFTG